MTHALVNSHTVSVLGDQLRREAADARVRRAARQASRAARADRRAEHAKVRVVKAEQRAASKSQLAADHHDRTQVLFGQAGFDW